MPRSPAPPHTPRSAGGARARVARAHACAAPAAQAVRPVVTAARGGDSAPHTCTRATPTAQPAAARALAAARLPPAAAAAALRLAAVVGVDGERGRQGEAGELFAYVYLNRAGARALCRHLALHATAGAPPLQQQHSAAVQVELEGRHVACLPEGGRWRRCGGHSAPRKKHGVVVHARAPPLHGRGGGCSARGREGCGGI
jgi:hypothetical protein